MNLRAAHFGLGSVLVAATFVGAIVDRPARAEAIVLSTERTAEVDSASEREEDVSSALARLSSASATDRSLAQRWLATHLGPGDLAAVSGAARSGDAEVRARI